jgi:Ribonuclease G/E
MEDLIPLLIVIAISIIGAVTRKKKRPEGQNIAAPGQSNRRDNEIYNWLEKLGIDEEEVRPFSFDKPFTAAAPKVVVNETPSLTREPVKEPVPNKFAQYAGFISPEEREQIMAKEGVSVVKSKKDESESIQKTSDTQANDLEDQKFDFDLRRAVVFSEILNRKYV